MTIFVTANIGRGVSSAVAKRNIVKVRKAFGDADPLVCWQEIDADDTPGEHALVRGAFRPADYEHVMWDGHEPISVPKDHFTHVGTGRRFQIQEAVGHDEPGKATAAKWITTVLVTPRGCTEKVAVVNTHFPNFEVNDPRWQHCRAALRDHLQQMATNKITTVWQGDTNANMAKNMPLLVKGERRLHNRGNDYMGIIPGSVRVQVMGKGSIDLTIDGHDAKWARLQFKDRRR